MIATAPAAIAIADASQVGAARRNAARLAEAAAFDEGARGAAALVATELATNLVRYGTNGRMLLRAVPDEDGAVEIIAVDQGPGMADVDRCLQDGYSTGGTSGTGLGAVRRMAAAFDIYSSPGTGTVVMARIAPRGARATARRFRWGGVSTAAPNEELCGDIWRVAESDGQMAVMVADGLGHGPLAAAAAALASEAFTHHAFAGPAAFCQRAHQALSGSRGAAIALAHVKGDGTVSYAGVGNISGALVSLGQSRGLMSQNGTAGFQMRTARALDYAWPQQGCLVMHSDGLTNRWSLDAYPGLLRCHPAVIAAVLHRDCLRGRDDATVVVLAEALVS